MPCLHDEASTIQSNFVYCVLTGVQLSQRYGHLPLAQTYPVQSSKVCECLLHGISDLAQPKQLHPARRFQTHTVFTEDESVQSCIC